MSENNYGKPGNEGAVPGSGHHHAHRDPRPYWKSVHHTWWFWVGLVLMLTAMAIYVLSYDLAFLPWR